MLKAARSYGWDQNPGLLAPSSVSSEREKENTEEFFAARGRMWECQVLERTWDPLKPQVMVHE